MVRCKGGTNKGFRCKYRGKYNGYCGYHRYQDKTLKNDKNSSKLVKIDLDKKVKIHKETDKIQKYNVKEVLESMNTINLVMFVSFFLPSLFTLFSINLWLISLGFFMNYILGLIYLNKAYEIKESFYFDSGDLKR